MSNHLLNLYEIKNLNDLRSRYRLVDIDGPFGLDRQEHDLAEKNLNLLAKQVAYQEKAPVALLRREQSALLAIPANVQLSKTEYALSPDVVSLKPQEEVHNLGFHSASMESRNIALSFLRFRLNSPLYANRSLWAASAGAYFSKRPVNLRDNGREADVYGGFGFRLRFVDDRLFLVLRLLYRYADSSWLIDRYTIEQMRELKMRHLLYHFGHRWYTVQLLDVPGKSIRDMKFVIADKQITANVFDYTLQETKPHPQWIQSLDPNSPAVVYRYPGSERHAYGAAALGKLLLSTEAPEIRSLHRLSIKGPDHRFSLMNHLAEEHFANADFDGTPVRISAEPFRAKCRVFAFPALEFGQGAVLRVGNRPDQGEVEFRDVGKARLDMLLDPEAGFAVTGAFDKQYLIVPQSTDRAIQQDFQKRLEATIRDFAHIPYRMDPIVYNDGGARTLKQQVDAVLTALGSAKVTHGHGILVLPEFAKTDLHNYLKRRLQDTVQVQSVSARKLKEFYGTLIKDGRVQTEVLPEREQRYASYLRYTALGLMIVNRQWGWVLTEGTHYDAYVAFDVLHNTAAFTFFYEGGRRCFLRSCQSRQKEKLLRKQVCTMVYDNLRKDLADGQKPRSIILRRDGKLFETEWLGFCDAMSKLIAEGVLPPDVLYGAVEVQKHTSSAIRIAAERAEGPTNPRVGTAFELDSREGLVCTTGYPFRFPGTARPLQVLIARGKLDLMWILEDIFRMSSLAWEAPDRCMLLPIDLKLCDEFLRAIAAAADEDEALYGEENEDLADAISSA